MLVSRGASRTGSPFLTWNVDVDASHGDFGMRARQVGEHALGFDFATPGLLAGVNRQGLGFAGVAISSVRRNGWTNDFTDWTTASTVHQLALCLCNTVIGDWSISAVDRELAAVIACAGGEVHVEIVPNWKLTGRGLFARHPADDAGSWTVERVRPLVSKPPFTVENAVEILANAALGTSTRMRLLFDPQAAAVECWTDPGRPTAVRRVYGLRKLAA